jgi:hypothetical protein
MTQHTPSPLEAKVNQYVSYDRAEPAEDLEEITGKKHGLGRFAQVLNPFGQSTWKHTYAKLYGWSLMLGFKNPLYEADHTSNDWQRVASYGNDAIQLARKGVVEGLLYVADGVLWAVKTGALGLKSVYDLLQHVVVSVYHAGQQGTNPLKVIGTQYDDLMRDLLFNRSEMGNFFLIPWHSPSSNPQHPITTESMLYAVAGLGILYATTAWNEHTLKKIAVPKVEKDE